MKKVQRISIIWLITIVFVISPILKVEVFSEDQAIHNFDKANKLKMIGLIQGSENGFNLDKEVTRIEGAVMLVRLLGKESIAQEEKFKHNFQDVPSWASDYVGYLYAKGLSNGISDTIFGSNDKMSISQYVTFLLRALGYDDRKGDFKWDQALDKAIEINLISDDELKIIIYKDKFLRDDMIGLSYNALRVNLKDSEDNLIDKLINEGQVAQEIAEEIELFPNSQSIEFIYDGLNINRWPAVYYKKFYGNGKYYYYERDFDMKPEFEIISDKAHLTFEGFNWNETDMYNFYFQAGNKLYPYNISTKDMGKSIEIVDDIEYGTVEISVPFSKGDYYFDAINLHIIPDTSDISKSIQIGSFGNNMMLPEGTYSIQVNAYDSENIYSLYKKSFKVNPGKNTIEFSKNEVSKIKVNVDYGDYENMKLKFVNSFCHDGFYFSSGFSYNVFQNTKNSVNLYATNINTNISITVDTDDGWSYCIDRELENVQDSTVNFDLNFEGQINLEEEAYLPGHELIDKFDVFDSLGNQLNILYNPKGQTVGGIVEFIKSGHIEAREFDHLGYTKIKLPTEPGEYIMKIKVVDGPIKIKEVSKKIKIIENK